MTNCKQLCAELVRIADALDSTTPLAANQGQALDGYAALAAFRDVAFRARAALAKTEPEPEGQSALDDVHYEWELEDYEGEWQAGGSANSLEDAQRDGMRYLQIYTQDGFHRLIIRRHCTKIIQEINNA